MTTTRTTAKTISQKAMVGEINCRAVGVWLNEIGHQPLAFILRAFDTSGSIWLFSPLAQSCACWTKLEVVKKSDSHSNAKLLHFLKQKRLSNKSQNGPAYQTTHVCANTGALRGAIVTVGWSSLRPWLQSKHERKLHSNQTGGEKVPWICWFRSCKTELITIGSFHVTSGISKFSPKWVIHSGKKCFFRGKQV